MPASLSAGAPIQRVLVPAGVAPASTTAPPAGGGDCSRPPTIQ